VLLQVLAQLGGLVRDVGEDAVETAVGVDQLGCGLLAHAGHARQVVGRIAAQRGVLDVVAGVDPGALEDAGLVVQGVVGHAALVVEDLHVGVLDELVAVAVAGDDDDVVAALLGQGGQGGDDVVGLDAGLVDGGDAERVDHLAHQRHLLASRCRGAASRWALYSGFCSWRKVGSGRSNATATASGWWSRTRLMNIDVNPNTALVTCPEAVTRSVGRAWNAAVGGEFPSISMNRIGGSSPRR
jgi:hypothetical protein